MPKAVTYPDVEHLVVDYLTIELADVEGDVTCGVGVPERWKPGSPSHVQVVSDGVPTRDGTVAAHAIVRLVARAATTTEAKRLAGVALGLLAAHPGGGGIARTRALTGPLPAREPETGAELASTTARVTLRSTPIVPAAS